MIRDVVFLTRWFDSRRAPLALQVLTLIVVLSVAPAAAGVFWRVSGLDDGRDRIALGEPIVGSAAPSDLAPILAWAPFGGSIVSSQSNAAGLILKAVFMAVPAEASSALIAVGDAPAVAVRPGQALSSGAIVQSVGVDHVILLAGGQAQRLDFPASALPPGSEAALTTTISAPAYTAPSAPFPAAAPSAAGASASNAATIPSVVELYRQRLAGNAPAVARDLGVTSTPQGYRVGEDLAPALRAAGLQPGDVVSKVNNQAMGSDANPRALLDQAITSGGARVEVVRSGRTLTLSFPLR